MFAKDKVSQSLIDAVNEVVAVTEAKADELPPIDKDAAAARKARQARLDAIEDAKAAKAERGGDEKSTSAVRRVAGKAYGGSKQKDDDDEMDEAYDCVTKPEAKGIAKKVVKGHEKAMHKEGVELTEGKMKDIYGSMMKHATKKGYSSPKQFTKADYETVGKKHGVSGADIAVIGGHHTADSYSNLKEDKSFGARLLIRARLNEGGKGPVASAPEDFTDNNIGEMTDAQTKKKEKIVLSMKDKEGDFKAKYGKNWKNVMYATATKLAMAEDYVLDEDKDDGVPFDRPYSKTPAKVTDKGGNVHTPMSRVKHLAKTAMKKLTKETMMGKAGTTSEETENE